MIILKNYLWVKVGGLYGRCLIWYWIINVDNINRYTNYYLINIKNVVVL